MGCGEGDYPVQGQRETQGWGGAAKAGSPMGTGESSVPPASARQNPGTAAHRHGARKPCPDSSSAQPAAFACLSQNPPGLRPGGKLRRLRSSVGLDPSPSQRAGGTRRSAPSLLGPRRAVAAAAISKSIFPPDLERQTNGNLISRFLNSCSPT